MTRRWGGCSALLMAALLPAACMKTVDFSHSEVGGNGGANGLGGGPGNGGSIGFDGGNWDVPGDNRGNHCSGGNSFGPLNVEQEVPAIMFALDRSPSMTRTLGTFPNTRFTVTAKAIVDTVNNYSGVAKFGYVEFPGTLSDGSCPQSGCCAGGFLSVAQLGSDARAISNKLGMCTTNTQNNCPQTNETPTGQALNKIANTLQNSGQWLYAVVLTDGAPSAGCSLNSVPSDACDQTQQQITSMSNAKISTFVVAIGDIPTDDCLSNMAALGGHPAAPTPPFYFSANTDTSVRSQIDAIVASTICNIDIKDQFDANRPIEVDFGNWTIPPDPTRTNGWDLDQNKGRITIYGLGAGQACNTLIQGLKNTPHHVVVKGCLDTSHPFQQPGP